MDQKTLDYMGAKVDKARELNRRIEFLNKAKDAAQNPDEFKIEGKENRYVHTFSRRSTEYKGLVIKCSEALVSAIKAEIDELQKELDEL